MKFDEKYGVLLPYVKGEMIFNFEIVIKMQRKHLTKCFNEKKEEIKLYFVGDGEVDVSLMNENEFLINNSAKRILKSNRRLDRLFWFSSYERALYFKYQGFKNLLEENHSDETKIIIQSYINKIGRKEEDFLPYLI